MRRIAPFLCLLLLGATAAPRDQDASRRFLITGFERIRVDGPFVVEVQTGKPVAAQAEGDRRALERLSLRVNGGTLSVSAGAVDWDERRNPGEGPARVTLSVPSLAGAYINGGGRLSIDRMAGQRVDLGVNGAASLEVGDVAADRLNATLTGMGRLTVAGKAMDATFSNYGAGSIEASGLVANELTVRSNSSGGGTYQARFIARVNANGLGGVTIDGNPKCFLSGSAPVQCGDGGNVERR